MSQWGGIATVLRHYDVIAPRIDEIVAKRTAEPSWDPARTPLLPPLTAEQLAALQGIYNVPASMPNGVTFNVGRWLGSEAQWKSSHGALLGYLRDSMPRFDPTFNRTVASLQTTSCGFGIRRGVPRPSRRNYAGSTSLAT